MTTPSEVLYRLIPLTQGQWAIVDVADFEWLNQYKWCAAWDSHTKGYYAMRRCKGRIVRMHRIILGLDFGDKRKGDHINLETLDNRRSNLRIATNSQNGCNSGMKSTNSTGFKGVDFEKRRGLYRAYIQKDGKLKFLGYKSTAEAAYELYCAACAELHGEFGRTV